MLSDACPGPSGSELRSSPIPSTEDGVESAARSDQRPASDVQLDQTSLRSGARQRDGGGAGRAGTSGGHLITPPLAPGLLDPGPAFGDGSWSRT